MQCIASPKRKRYLRCIFCVRSYMYLRMTFQLPKNISRRAAGEIGSPRLRKPSPLYDFVLFQPPLPPLAYLLYGWPLWSNIRFGQKGTETRIRTVFTKVRIPFTICAILNEMFRFLRIDEINSIHIQKNIIQNLSKPVIVPGIFQLEASGLALSCHIHPKICSN